MGTVSTAGNSTVNGGLNGYASNYGGSDGSLYDGLGILTGFNTAGTTSFASFGSGGTANTGAGVLPPVFDVFVDWRARQDANGEFVRHEIAPEIVAVSALWMRSMPRIDVQYARAGQG